MYFFEQLLYEENIEDPEDDELDGVELDDLNQTNALNTEQELIAVPIKKYFLIRKLFALNDKLNRLRIKSDVMNVVINFVDSFSYPALLIISGKLIEELSSNIKTEEPVTNT